MYTAQIENAFGESLVLTGNEKNWQVISITGLNPANAQVNLMDIAGLDGAKFNSSKLTTREIVIMLKINGNVEENRHTLYQYFRTKEFCKFYFKNGSRDVYIPGYVETVECELFSNGEIMQVSILCPYPYFRALAQSVVDVSNEVAGFKFPFSINVGEPIPFSVYVENRIVDVVNNSESETGCLIEIDVLDTIRRIEIRNTDTGESMILNYGFHENDRVLIDTNKGQKSIHLLRNGVTTNIFPAMQKGSVFFQLQVGSNHFGYLVDGGTAEKNVLITFTFSKIYRGV